MTIDQANGADGEQIESKLTMIKGAEHVLESAKADRLKYPENAYMVDMTREDTAAPEEHEVEAKEERNRELEVAMQLSNTSGDNEVEEDEEDNIRLPTPPPARGRK